MSLTKFFVIRHGETIWNTQGIKQGHLDSPLNSVGVRQAQAIAVRLAEEPFAHLYSSDLGRAYGTAQLIAAQTGHEIITDARLRERNFGIFQGSTDAEVKAEYPLEHRSHLDDKERYVIPEGESLQQFFARAVACLEDLSVRHNGQDIAVVTHGGVIDAWFRFVLDIPLHAPRKAKLWNVGLNCIAREDDGEWRLHTWGDRSHVRFINTLDDI